MSGQLHAPAALPGSERSHVILRLKRDGTRAETRFRLSAKRTNPFKSAGTSVQSTTGSRGVRISSSNAGYTTFRGSVRVLATHSIRQFPLHFSNLASPCAITFQLDATHEIGQGCPTSDQSSCVRDPPPQRYIIYTLPKIAQKFSRLRIPLTIIFTSAAPIPAQKMVLPRHPSEENPT